MRSSASIGLVLIGTTLAAVGFDAHQNRKSLNSDVADEWNDGDFSDAATRPSSGPGSTHYYRTHNTGWFSPGFWHHSSSGSRSSSFSHSSTSRGGFGSHGHSGG